MQTIVLVPCGKRKQHSNTPIEAENMYIGSFFKKAMLCAKSMKPDAIYILSAKYHVVPPEKKLEYYDMVLSKQSASFRRKWAETVLSQLNALGVNLQDDKIVFLTGQYYYNDIIGHIKNYDIVGKGLSIGCKIQKFNEIIKKNYK